MNEPEARMQIHRLTDEIPSGGDNKTMSDLHKDFHPVQRGGASATDSPRRCARHQVLPPAARALFLLCEFIWDGETVANVQHLETTGIQFLKSDSTVLSPQRRRSTSPSLGLF